MTRVARLALACLVLSPLLPGCDDDGNGVGPPGAVAGTWRLRFVNQARLPTEQFVSSLVRPTGCDVQTLQGSLLSLRPDETFTATFDLELECDGVGEERTITSSGTYDRTGETVQFTTVDLIDFDGALGPDAACGGPSMRVLDPIFQLDLLYCLT